MNKKNGLPISIPTATNVLKLYLPHCTNKFTIFSNSLFVDQLLPQQFLFSYVFSIIYDVYLHAMHIHVCTLYELSCECFVWLIFNSKWWCMAAVCCAFKLNILVYSPVAGLISLSLAFLFDLTFLNFVEEHSSGIYKAWLIYLL